MSESPAMRHLDVTLNILNIMTQIMRHISELEFKVKNLEAIING